MSSKLVCLFVIFTFCVMSAKATAKSCSEIDDNADRLACYDAAHCAVIGEGEARLACYDKLPSADTKLTQKPVPRVKQLSVTTTQVEETPVAETTESSKRASLFGLKKYFTKADEIEHVEATIVQVQIDANRRHYVKLDNDQVWKETSPSRIKFKSGQSVRIEAGSFGSFRLRVVGQKRTTKVMRTK